MFARVQFEGHGWTSASLRATQILRCDPPDYRPVLLTTTGPARTWADPLAALDWLARDQDRPWYGFLSYDLGRWFETLPAYSIDDRALPLFAFMTGEPTDPIAPHVSPTAQVQAMPTVTRDEYQRQIERCLNYIRAGDVFQINLSQRLRVPQVEAPETIYARLQAQTPANYAAFLDFGDFQLISNSPELFLEQDRDRHVVTRPIKGTRALRESDQFRQSTPMPTDAHLTPIRAVANDRPRDETSRKLSPSRQNIPIADRNEPCESISTDQSAAGVFEKVATPLRQNAPRAEHVGEISDTQFALRKNDSMGAIAEVLPSAVEILRDSAKDAAELNMIIDLERNDLGRVCEIGSVRVTQRRTIESHPTLVHGVATIEGRLRTDATFVNLLCATFPGGSITGAPKIRAMQIIDQLEPHRRGPYCGAIGVIRPDGSHTFNIAIRTMVIHRGVIDVQVGGGIVADSIPSEEFEETLVKARAMFDALGVTA